MNKELKVSIWFFVTGLMFGSVISTNAQKRVIKYAEAEKIIDASRTLLWRSTYRETYTEEEFQSRNGASRIVKRVIREEIPEKANRSVTTTYLKDGKVEKREFVYIDGKPYRRTDDGPWDTTPADLASLVGPPIPDEGPVRSTNAAWFIEETSVGGKQTNVYEIRNTTSYLENRRMTNYISLERYWIGADGRILRKLSENSVVGRPQITKGVTEYEYENIAIERPVIR